MFLPFAEDGTFDPQFSDYPLLHQSGHSNRIDNCGNSNQNSFNRRLTRPSSLSSSSMGNVGPTSRYNICTVCGMEHHSTKALKEHITQFHGLKLPYTCSKCGKGFMSNTGLKNHMVSHEGRKFVCDLCTSRFYLKHHLKAHLQLIHKMTFWMELHVQHMLHFFF